MSLLMKPEPFSREVDRLFDRLFDSPSAAQRWAPAMDLVEAEDHYLLKADLPGVSEEDVAIEGTTIPQGSTCIMMLASANRDERHFANPDVFDIHRPDLDVAKAFSGAASHVQFILGRHFCVGSLLAREEMTVALNLILDRLPGLRYQEGFEPKEVGLYTRSVESLLVEFDPPAA